MYSLPKIIAIVVLLAVTSMLSGADSAFSAVPVEKAVKSCCGGCGQDEDRESPAPFPQSAPHCPAFMCLSFDVVEPMALRLDVSDIFPSLAFIPEAIPDPFIKSIFHPPTLR